MKKRNTIIYWVSTIWLASGMLAGGIQQLFLSGNFVEIFESLGYHLYFMHHLGVWKILGTIAFLVPGYRLLKEWTYAGFFFVCSGVLFYLIAAGHPLTAVFPVVILLALTAIYWYFLHVSK